MSKPKENKNCPYCLSLIEPEQERVRCPKCGVLHHTECWTANGKCSVYGCDGWVQWQSEIGEKIAPQPSADVEKADLKKRSRSDAVKTAPCMKCGRPIRSDQLLCWNCSLQRDPHRWDNCVGPSVLFVAGVVWAVSQLVRVLT